MSAYGNTLRRSVMDRQIAGVCGGLGEYFGIDTTAVRVAYVLLSVFSAGFPGMLVYVILVAADSRAGVLLTRCI